MIRLPTGAKLDRIVLWVITFDNVDGFCLTPIADQDAA